MLGLTEELEELDWYEDKPYSPYVRVEEAVYTLQGLRRAYVYVKSPRSVPRLPKPAVNPPRSQEDGSLKLSHGLTTPLFSQSSLIILIVFQLSFHEIPELFGLDIAMPGLTLSTLFS